MIIGLNGRLKSGKDTTYGIIKEFNPEAIRISFAEKLKTSAAASLGIDVDTLEDLKGREDLFFEMGDRHRFNIRQYLQWYGTEGHRDIFGDDFWVDQALPLDIYHDNKLFVVTDMRFPNEFERVKALHGVRVKVERETATNHGSHASEQNLDHMIDYFLDNTGTIDDLRTNVYNLIVEHIAPPEYRRLTSAYSS